MSVVDVHRRLSSSTGLLAARRAVYEGVADLVGFIPDGSSSLAGARELESPFVRNALGAALSSGRPVESGLARTSLWSVQGAVLRGARGVADIPVITMRDADDLLSDVLAALRAGPVALLTERSPTRCRAAVATLQAGIDLAGSLHPELVADLLPHVSLVGVLDGAEVHSATLRQYPGLLLLEEPRSALHAAEMLLHEAAHARLFDMLTVHEILPSTFANDDRFAPSWRGPGVHWEMEQALAGLHAYAVMDDFFTTAGSSIVPGPDSLLPNAAQRVVEIGDWILGRIDRLGADARTFVVGLRGGDSHEGRMESARLRRSVVRVSPGVRLWQAANDEFVVASREARMVFVLDPDTGFLLDSLSRLPGVEHTLSSAVRIYMRRCRQTSRKPTWNLARQQVALILNVLSARALVHLHESGSCPARAQARRWAGVKNGR